MYKKFNTKIKNFIFVLTVVLFLCASACKLVASFNLSDFKIMHDFIVPEMPTTEQIKALLRQPEVSKSKQFERAIAFGNLNQVKELIAQGVNVNSFESEEIKHTPLTLGVTFGSFNIVKELIEAYADINAPDVNMHTPLDTASGAGAKKEIIKYLAAAGGQLFACHAYRLFREPYIMQGEELFKNLINAAKAGDNCFLNNIKKTGYTLVLRDRFANTLLHYAVLNNHKALVITLLESSPKLIEQKNIRNLTPLELAVGNNHQILILLMNLAFAKLNYAKTAKRNLTNDILNL